MGQQTRGEKYNTRTFQGLPHSCSVKNRLMGQVVWQYRWPFIATEVFAGLIVVPVSM